MSVNRLLAGIALLTLGLIAGCGSKSDAPETTPVRGTVTFNGEPLKSGTVSFVPAKVTTGSFVRPATTEIQPDGTFVASSFNPEDGLVPGEYRVSVVSYEVLPDPAKPGSEVWAIPRKYGNPETSELKVSVPDDGETVVADFKLEGEKNK